MRFLRVLSAAMLVWALAAPAFSAAGVKSKKQVARSQFQKAQRMREALNGRPAAERSRREYEKVVDAYRRVYYTSPTSSQASTSVLAVAELLAESGRAFRDEKLLRAAIGQYKFLRREYPGSKYRFEALFTIGQIYKDDLEDAGQARASFEEFLKHYPRNHLADDARQAIADLDRQAREPETRAEKKAAPLPLVTGIRHWSAPDYTRVAIDLEGDVKYDADRIPDPDRIFFDLHDTRLSSTLVGKTFDVDDGFLRKIRVAQYQPGQTRVVLEVGEVADYTAFMLPNPYRLVVDIHGKRPQKLQAGKPGADKAGAQEPEEVAQGRPPRKNGATGENRPVEVAKAEVKPAPPSGKPTLLPEDAARLKAPEAHPDAASSAAPGKAARTESKPPPAEAKSKSTPARKTAGGREAKPTANGERSLIRALGLKIGRIVVDAGHGGHDTGTIGPNGLMEKDLTLDVALRLGKLLENRLGAEVTYTRDDDTFIPLETRPAIANQNQADLFISIHANSSRERSARGVETYYLNFTSSPDALEVAARENAVSEKSIHELQDLVKKITLKDKIEESREFASDVQNALHSGLAVKSAAIRDRGVKKAPFIVLIGANMPAILAEISFVSNPTDARRLKTAQWRQRIAESLYRGIAKYASGLSGVKVASKLQKEESQ